MIANTQYGGVYFGQETAGEQWISDLTNVTFGTTQLNNGGASGTIFTKEFLTGTDTFHETSASQGSIDCGPYTPAPGYYGTVRCKFDPRIFSVGPVSSSGSGQFLQSGGTITLYGSGFGSQQCSGCSVWVYPAAIQLKVSSWSDQTITATLPPHNGLETLLVYAANGLDSINFMAANGTLSAGTVLGAGNDGYLYSLGLSTATNTLLGPLPEVMSDIAAFNGALYGVSFSNPSILFRINPNTGAGLRIGTSTGADLNSLVFSPQGILYAAGGAQLFTLNTATGVATPVNTTSSYSSAGDLEFDASGRLYLTSHTSSYDDLFSVDPSTGQGTRIGSTGFVGVFGLAYLNGTMYGFTQEGDVLTVNLTTGLGTRIASYSPNFDGATTFSTTASSCAYLISPGGQAFNATGGNGTITLTTGTGCSWSTSAPSWITITSSVTGTNSGTIAFRTAANGGSARSGTITVGGLPFEVEQAAVSVPGSAVGSFGQVTSEGTWDFSISAVNLGTSAAQSRFTFLDDNGAALPLPLTFPQSTSGIGPLIASVLDRTINPNSQLVIQSSGPDSAATLTGSGQLSANGNVSSFGIFSNPTYKWEAVVPLETRNASSYVLAFDNTAALVTGVAVANVATQAANVPVLIRDDTGAPIGTATINLTSLGHTSFLLSQQYPITVGKRGTIELDTPLGGQISVLGLRNNGAALTTLPVLAAVGTGGGSIAHVTYNGGFTSLFYLVNTGIGSAQFTLSFFNEGGSPLAVPLLLPQSGTTTTTSALTRTLAGGAMLVVETQAQDALASVSGSAQLTTTGNISGFEIFRWTTFGQEASVPLETRAPNSFVLVFDDTNALTTGVALANLSASASNVTLNLRNDGGVLLQTTTLNLPAHGHTSFLLPSNYPLTSGVRGIAEFVVPAGGKISVIGLRATADGTLTTIPVFAK